MESRKNKPLLTISLLISDRLDTIPRCLDSLRSIMEQIPSELILVDTSKNPKVHELLLSYTDKVYDFEWCKDFAKARNVGMRHATGEWFLFLDDDEWFVEIEPLVKFFQSGEYKKYGYAHYRVRNFYDPNYAYYSDSWVSRMIRLDKDTHFKGKIHEHFYPVYGECKYIDALAYHSGYIFITEEEKRAHFERNATLLLDMMKEEPNNLRWSTQYAQEFRSVKEWDGLYDFCKEQIEVTKHIDDEYENIYIGTFWGGVAVATLMLKRYDETLEMCLRCVNDKRTTELCKAFMYISIAEATFHLGKYEEARKYLSMYFGALETLPKNRALVELQSMALYVNETFDETVIRKAYSILICCGIMQGSKQELKQYYDKLELDAPVLYVYDGTEKYFIEAMVSMEYDPILSQIITDGYKNKEFRDLLRNEAQTWFYKDKKAFQKIMYVHAQADSDDWYIWYARIHVAGGQKNREEMANAIMGFYRTFPNVFVFPEELGAIAEENDIAMASGWVSVASEKWRTNTKDYLDQIGEEHLESTRSQMRQVFSPQEWRYQYFELAVLERAVKKGPKTIENLQSHVDLLQACVNETLRFYGQYYKEEAFMEYPEVLPQNIQAVIQIMQFCELEREDTVAALNALKEAALLNPEWANGLRRFIEFYPELERQRVRKQKEEMRNLKKQVMQQVEDMLAKGQAEAALGIIAQLKQMIPNDLEILELGLRARLKSLE